ncbi:MAG: site-2 protease family protein [Planctomycetaceae bacterium]|jgi:Zn-dependent protease|nr:site-2 protease family protein [Planctomycetaceae bacterium]
MQNLRFSLLGFSVTIQPFFWFVAVLIGSASLGTIDDTPVWLAKLAVFVSAVLISVLVHELGHALAFRYLYGVPSSITVHFLGGLTAPLLPVRRTYTAAGTFGQMFLAFSGPLAGFILAGVMIMFRSALPEPHLVSVQLITHLFGWTFALSIIWGIFNLLPIYPMDGGHIARELLAFIFPHRGVRYSLMLSMTCAAVLAILALRMQSLPMVCWFVYMTYMNYQELSRRQ